jgi:NADH dehydrogenase
VVDLSVPVFGALRFSGFFAWLFWLFAHIYFLIGFRNRLVVLIDWAWAYFTFERHARVVAEASPPTTDSQPTQPPVMDAPDTLPLRRRDSQSANP